MRYNKKDLRRLAAYHVFDTLLVARSENPRFRRYRDRIDRLEEEYKELSSDSKPLDIQRVARVIEAASQLELDLAIAANEEAERIPRDHGAEIGSIFALFPSFPEERPLTRLHEWREVWVQRDSRERSRKSIAAALTVLGVLALAPLPIRITIAGCALTILLTIKVLLVSEIELATSVLRGRISLHQQFSQLSLLRVALALGGIVAGTRTASESRPRPQA